jgi:uncharacterized protein with von Willebrand factor type A (vWA) domain
VTAPAAERLVRRLARFARALRGAGVQIGPNRVPGALEALEVVDVTSREESYWALRCALISRCEDVDAFDEVFEAFWHGGPIEEGGPPRDDDPLRHDDDENEPESDEPPGRTEDRLVDAGEEAGDDAASEDGDDDGPEETGLAFSAGERLRQLDFAAYTDVERVRVRRLLEHLPAIAPMRRSRRLAPARDGRVLDPRRMLRSAMRTDGHPVVREYRRRREVPRRVVFIVDISGSMRPYARATLMFLNAAVRAGRRVEALAVGPPLTRVTRELSAHDPDAALRAAARAVPDWAGGTRIGDNLKALNDQWGARGMTRGAIVVIVSDGWERGEVDLLAGEMERLRRAAHTVVWVNPLAGEEGYEPVAQGMAAALPHLDHFLPGHNLASLETLATVLERLPAGRHAGAAPAGGKPAAT